MRKPGGIGELAMTNSGPGPGQSPFGGSRHRSRPARPVFAPPPVPVEDDPPRIGPAPDAVALDVCPWLYLNIEPDTRGASVTDDHRCELVPDITPGPGHQVAYCLTPNHRGCPQLRGYEAQRRTAALGAAQQAEIVPFPVPLQATPSPARPSRGRGASRWIWAAFGALSALLLGAGVVFYTMPALALTAPEEELSAQSEPQQISPPTATASAPLIVPDIPAPIQNGDAPNWNASSDGAAGAAANATGPTADGETPETYVVALGDTLSSIARQFGVTIDALIAANDIGDDSLLVTVGDELVIPSP